MKEYRKWKKLYEWKLRLWRIHIHDFSCIFSRFLEKWRMLGILNLLWELGEPSTLADLKIWSPDVLCTGGWKQLWAAADQTTTDHIRQIGTGFNTHGLLRGSSHVFSVFFPSCPCPCLLARAAAAVSTLPFSCSWGLSLLLLPASLSLLLLLCLPASLSPSTFPTSLPPPAYKSSSRHTRAVSASALLHCSVWFLSGTEPWQAAPNLVSWFLLDSFYFLLQQRSVEQHGWQQQWQ